VNHQGAKTRKQPRKNTDRQAGIRVRGALPGYSIGERPYRCSGKHLILGTDSVR